MATSSEIQYRTITQFAQLYLNYVASNVPSRLVAPLGPVITAIAYATALVSVALQRIIQLVLKASRLSTAEGSDVDSFVADFGISRLDGVRARGTVTFSKNTGAVSAILIPVGSLVQTSTNPPIQYAVVPDSTKPNFSLSANGYYLNPGQTTVDVTVEAVLPGASGNASAVAINQIISSLPGIDNVSNAVGFVSGRDGESDTELRDRFVGYIQSLGKATKAAISAAINGVQPGLFFSISEYNGPGNIPNGIVNVYVDDGAGTIGGTLISQISGAIDAVRPAGVRVDVTAASPDYIGAMMRVVVDKNLIASHTDFHKILRSAVFEKVNALVLPGEKVHYAQFFKAIFNAISPGDVTQTKITSYPPSTTTVLQVESTEGLVVDQLIEVVGSTTFTKQLPRVTSIDGLNQIQISPALTALPTIGAVVKTFTVREDQIEDVHDLIVLKSAFMAGTTVSVNAVSATQFTVANAGGFVVGGYVILTNESTPDDFIYYQCSPAANTLPKITNVAGNVITISQPLGILTDESPHWLQAGTAGVPYPQLGTKVMLFAPTVGTPGTGDLEPTNSQQVFRLRAADTNSLLIQVEAV